MARSRSSSKLISFSSAAALAVAALAALAPAVAAQEQPANAISLSFLDETGAAAGDTLNVPFAECITIPLEGSNYATVTSTFEKAALNLYQDLQCQTLASSAVGGWPNADEVFNMGSVRWEGEAPASRPPGSLSPTAFPKEMKVQKPRDPNHPSNWVMDPSKGRIVVGLVAIVLVVGVLIGAIQVYRASQYKPPPKKPKQSTGVVGNKKVKKKDAYFKKPVQKDMHTFQRLHDETPQRSARNSQNSDAATFVEWNQQQRNMNNKGRYDADSISIDMRETRSSPYHGRSGSSTVNLIQFEDVPLSAHHGGRDRGRGGEVLVPMHTFESNYQPPRSTVRRPSGSRTR
ncbi:hypothetical protein BGX34_004922 [Mortierella sp. NVP85]|nr:hypothetical protein BGX34_004922 [Mortierella sp. NVP85]